MATENRTEATTETPVEAPLVVPAETKVRKTTEAAKCKVTFTNGVTQMCRKAIALAYKRKLAAYQQGETDRCVVAKVEGV